MSDVLEDQAGPIARPSAVTVLAVLQWLGGTVCLLIAGLLIVLAARFAETGVRPVLTVAGTIVGFAGVLQIVCGVGLWTLKPYGRVLLIVFACLGLLNIPFGTVVGILILFYLMKPGIQLLFSGHPAGGLSPEERAQVASASRENGLVIAVVVVCGVMFVVVAGGITAAIAVPGLLRARMTANEASARARIAAVQSAETTYASVTGHYAPLECLVDPPSCVPGSTQAPLLDASYTSGAPALGYDFRFQPGPSSGAPASPADALERGAAPPVRAGLQSYAYFSEPSGRRGRGAPARLCGDSTGALCALPDGLYPNRGRCGCR